MSRQQYLLLLALSMPLVTVLDVSTAVRAFISPSAATPSVPHYTFPATPIIDRVAMLEEAPLDDVKVSRRSDSFPDVELIDQYGRTHLFRTDLVQDKIVCIVFFYTECTGSCPGTIQTVLNLRNTLKNEFPQQHVQFLAISLDPQGDTPEKLEAYATSRGITCEDGLADWLFCTGSDDNIELIRRSLGLYDLDPEVDADRSQHAALIAFGNDCSDRWTAQPSGLRHDDLMETFLRIVGTSERQRFATRIGRSAEFMKTSAPSANLLSNPADKMKNGNKLCCSNPSECCSLPDANR